MLKRTNDKDPHVVDDEEEKKRNGLIIYTFIYIDQLLLDWAEPFV